MWGAIIGGAVSMLGSDKQSDAAGDAVNAQTQSAADATGELRRQFDQNRSDLAPWRAAGSAATTELAKRLGLTTQWQPGMPTPAGAMDINAWSRAQGYDMPVGRGWDATELANIQPEYQKYIASLAPAGGTPDPNTGSLLRRYTMADFDADPVTKKSFEFGMSEGQKAVQRMFGSRGLGRSGAAVKASSRFATDYTGQQAGASRERYVQDQTNEYNRLAGVAGSGQTAATNTAQMGTSMANGIADITIGTGNARGAAAIAGGNAAAGGLNSVGNAISGQFTMDRILNQGINGRLPGYTPRMMQGSSPGEFDFG